MRNSWIDFMNGYRDPITKARLREENLQNLKYEENNSLPSSMGIGERQCGFRVDGGTYAVVPTSPNGRPIEDFLLCKPLPVKADDFNLSNIGVKLLDIPEDCQTCGGGESKGVKTCQSCFGTGKENVTHIFDIVGKKYYPNVADFIEEARRLGISRRCELESSNEYARISSRSKLFLLHHRAIFDPSFINKSGEIELQRLFRAGCPRSLQEHTELPFTAPGCSALYWNVLEGGEEIAELSSNGEDAKLSQFGERFVERRLACGTYRGYSLPKEAELNFSLGIFAISPLGRFEVVDCDGQHESKLDQAKNSLIDVIKTNC